MTPSSLPPSSSAPHLHGLVRLGKLKCLSRRYFGVSLANSRRHFDAVSNLGRVLPERFDFGFERFSDIDDKIGLFSVEEPNLGCFMWLKTVRQVLWKVVRVTGGWVHRIHRCETAGTMIRVECIRAIRVMANDDIRLEGANLPHDLLAQCQVGYEFAISAAQKYHLLHPEHLRGVQLLNFSSRSQLMPWDERICCAFVARR